MTSKLCPFCQNEITSSLVKHIRAEHGEAVLRQAILADKQKGVSDIHIGEKYGVSFNYVEKTITREYGANISTLTPRRKKITHWEPKGFKAETSSVWSFKNRGSWATHDGSYRGNWSPYIPRNMILRYTQPGDVVLDYFIGGGTTAVESKLLGRRCIARDINPDALALTRDNLNFQAPLELFSAYGNRVYQPELVPGDARDLSSIENDSIDFICAHPPYAGIITYSADQVEGDLSSLSVPEFIADMSKIALESYRVLRPGRKCAILIGDSRKSKHVVPIAFQTIRAYLDAGFLLRELVIKRQHNCKTTGFWYSNSIRYNFLLLAHEFLPVFEKPEAPGTAEDRSPFSTTVLQLQPFVEMTGPVVKEKLETTSVWIFPFDRMKDEIRRNLMGRFSEDFYVIETRDIRKDGYIIPLGLLAYEHLEKSGMKIREIVIVTSEENRPFEPPPEGCLGIAHRYLLIYHNPLENSHRPNPSRSWVAQAGLTRMPIEEKVAAV